MKRLAPIQLICFCAVILVSSSQTSAQAAAASRPGTAVRSSSAFAEVLLKETELRAEVDSLLLEYTEDHPKVREGQFALGLIQKEKERVLAVKEKDAAVLTLALGKIMIRKVDSEIELWRLQQSLAEGHPDVKRARKKVETFEKAIKEILGQSSARSVSEITR